MIEHRESESIAKKYTRLTTPLAIAALGIGALFGASAVVGAALFDLSTNAVINSYDKKD